jgi:multiple sugar transport system substrate-binding protein
MWQAQIRLQCSAPTRARSGPRGRAIVCLRACLLPLLLLVAALAGGCGRGERSAGGDIHIRFWTFPLWSGLTGKEPDGKPEDWPAMKVREFERLHPGVKIDLEVLTWQGGGQKIDLGTISRTNPDLVYGAVSNIPKYADQGVLQPIDDYLTDEDRRDIYPNVLELCRYKGHTYLWPWLCNTLVMAVNRDVMRERGADHLVPSGADRSWTYDQFLAAARAATFDRDGDGRTDVYGYCLYGIPTSIEYQMLTLALGFGSSLYDEAGTRFALNSLEGRRGFQFLLDLLDKEKVTPPAPAGISAAQVGQMFFNREVAIVSAGSSLLEGLKAAVAKGQARPFDAVFVQPPHLPGKPPVTMLSLGGYYVFRQRERRKRDAVMAFARYMTDAASCRALANIGQLPTRRSAGDIYPGDLNMKVLSDLLPHARLYFTAHSPELQPILNNIYQQIFTHARTVEEALADAEKQANEVIRREAREGA